MALHEHAQHDKGQHSPCQHIGITYMENSIPATVLHLHNDGTDDQQHHEYIGNKLAMFLQEFYFNLLLFLI